MLFDKLGVSKKFGVSLVLFLIFPLVLLFAWINVNITQQLVENTCITNLEILKQSRTSIESTVLDIKDVSLSLIGNEELQKYLSTMSSDTMESSELQSDINATLTSIIASNSIIHRIAIFDESEIIFQKGEFLIEEIDEGLEEAALLQGKIVWVPAIYNDEYYFASDRGYEVSMIRVINNYMSYKEPMAYERISVREADISALYEGLASEETLEFYIMNGEGEIVSSIHQELLGTTKKDSSYFEYIVDTKEGYILQDFSQEVVSFYYISETDWYVVKVDELVAGEVTTLLQNIIAICILIAIFFGVSFYVIQRRLIIRPLIQLSKEVNQFREGEYEISLCTKSEDEIGALNQSFIEMSNYIQDLIERIYKSQIKEKDAQLKYLQSQINPHFLYNTLDSMRWMAIKEQQMEIAEQMEALSNLFKHALNEGREDTVLRKEIEHLENYIVIEKNKFGKRLTVNIDIDENLELDKCVVLNLILQPLVENAIIHGIEQKIGIGMIDVSVKELEGKIIYMVTDNGLGADQEEIRKRIGQHNEFHNALALNNINERIKLKYGDAFGIIFESEVGVGTTVTVSMPKEI